MTRSPQQIAADLIELADGLEAEAVRYREIAQQLAQRTDVRSDANRRSATNPITKSPKKTVAASAPGEAQRVLLSVFKAHPGETMTVPTVVRYAEQEGWKVKSQPAARATVQRMVNNGQIVKEGTGQYRLARPSDAEPSQSVHLRTPGSLMAPQSANGATTEAVVG